MHEYVYEVYEGLQVNGCCLKMLCYIKLISVHVCLYNRYNSCMRLISFLVAFTIHLGCIYCVFIVIYRDVPSLKQLSKPFMQASKLKYSYIYLYMDRDLGKRAWQNFDIRFSTFSIVSIIYDQNVNITVMSLTPSIA